MEIDEFQGWLNWLYETREAERKAIRKTNRG